MEEICNAHTGVWECELAAGHEGMHRETERYTTAAFGSEPETISTTTREWSAE